MKRIPLTLSPPDTEFSVFPLLYTRGRYYASPEWVLNVPIKNTDQEDAETSDLICMHMKNDAIINTNCIW